MKRTVSLLVQLAIITFTSCGPDKKERLESAAPVNNNEQLTDSQPRDKMEVATNPPPAIKDSVPVNAQDPAIEQPHDTVNEYLYKGIMIYRDNIGEFIDCSTQRVYYINDRTNQLRGKYYSFELPANAPLYVEVVGIYVKPEARAPKKYKRQMNISHLNAMERTVPFNCGGALTKSKENN